MLGPLTNSAALILGGCSGALLGKHIPLRVRQALPQTCGLLAIALGVMLITKVVTPPALALAMLLGTLLGELLWLEKGLEKMVQAVQHAVHHRWPALASQARADGFIQQYVTLVVLFSASGMGIFGALHEGMNGDSSILLTKSVLDLFTAAIFAAELGLAVALIAVPQMAVQGSLFASASLLLPLITPVMNADFSACGGTILLATGLRICGIKLFPVVNMLPALLLIMPCTALWRYTVGA